MFFLLEKGSFHCYVRLPECLHKVKMKAIIFGKSSSNSDVWSCKTACGIEVTGTQGLGSSNCCILRKRCDYLCYPLIPKLNHSQLGWFGRFTDYWTSIPSKIEWDLTNGPLSKLLELLDTQVEGCVQWVLLEISWIYLSIHQSIYLVTRGLDLCIFLQNHVLTIFISKNPFSGFACTSWQLFIFTTVLALWGLYSLVNLNVFVLVRKTHSCRTTSTYLHLSDLYDLYMHLSICIFRYMLVIYT